MILGILPHPLITIRLKDASDTKSKKTAAIAKVIYGTSGLSVRKSGKL